MLIIGELINSTRAPVKRALQERDEATIRRLAREQVEAGAHVLDVNTAAGREREIDDLEWAIGLIHEEAGEDMRLSIDSPDPGAIARGLELCRTRPLVNSITNEPAVQEQLIPLIREHDAEVIGLAMGGNGEGKGKGKGKGMPQGVEDRLREAARLIEALDAHEIALERLYIDPLVMTVGSNQEQARAVVETVRGIKARWGAQGVKTSVGLSNVSYGLPRRSVMNQAFLAMLIEAGLDAAIVDPTDADLMDALRASEALIGRDAHCLNYIKHMRARAKEGAR